MNSDPKDLVANTARVRVRSGAIGSEHVMAEGKVVAYSQHPQICVEADDGTQSWWPVTLPIDVVKTLPPSRQWRVTSQAGNEITVKQPNSYGEVPVDVATPTNRVLLSPAAARGLAAALNAAADEADR